MNEKIFIKKINESMKTKADELTKDFAGGAKFREIINKPLLKNWSSIIHIEYYALALISLVDNIMKNPVLAEKLKQEFPDIDKFYCSLKKCELCIYTLFCEIETLNILK